MLDIFALKLHLSYLILEKFSEENKIILPGEEAIQSCIIEIQYIFRYLKFSEFNIFLYSLGKDRPHFFMTSKSIPMNTFKILILN